MKKHVLVVIFAITIGHLFQITAIAQDLVVDQEGPLPSLRAALSEAEPGDRIFVKSGVYREGSLVIDKQVTIEGNGDAIFDGEKDFQIFLITADSVTVRGLVFRNVGTSYVEDRAAVKVEEAHSCTIENNRFENTYFAVYIAQSSGCRIVDNEIIGPQTTESRSANGIHIWYSKNILVANNRIRGHRDGIYFEFVEDSFITGNTSESNNRYGLHFMFSDGCSYSNNVFRHNNAGVAVMYTQNVEMTGNLFEDNWGPASFGLLLKDITDSRIEQNAFVKNTIGLYAEGSNRISVRSNKFVENGWAVKIMANAMDNEFSRNNFVANTFDVSTNSRMSNSQFVNNYWDRYEGYDLDRNGYGDIPFRPVRLFSLIVEKNEPSLILLRSFFIDALDTAERIFPTLTPETLRDDQPVMQPFVL